MNLATAIVFLPGLVIGLTLHECAHAWSASLLGDDFSRRQGRVSLNPFRHLTPLGTLAILFLPFGWGRPVPVNLYNFAHPRRDYLLTSLAGPAANFLLAAICLSLMHFFMHPFDYEGWRRLAVLLAFALLQCAVLINVMLATLNLLPIPPLDGSKIWPCVLPKAKAAIQAKNGMFFLVVLVVLFSTHTLDPLLKGALHQVTRLMPSSDLELLLKYRQNGQRAINGQRWEEAEAAFGQALAIDPHDNHALSGRAIARLCLKKPAQAQADIAAAIAINPLPAYLEIQEQITAATGKKPSADGHPGQESPAKR